jgi:hypothetical protein
MVQTEVENKMNAPVWQGFDRVKAVTLSFVVSDRFGTSFGKNNSVILSGGEPMDVVLPGTFLEPQSKD